VRAGLMGEKDVKGGETEQVGGGQGGGEGTKSFQKEKIFWHCHAAQEFAVKHLSSRLCSATFAIVTFDVFLYCRPRNSQNMEMFG